jgi:hypothetical protein
MYYDGVRGMLLVPKGLGEIAAIRVELGHRIAVEFEAEPSV